MSNNASTLRPVEDGQEGASPSRQSNAAVLAIDDDPAFLETLHPLLREEGFNVLTCTSGAKALTMLQCVEHEIRVVLLDYSMPHLDGAETLQYLRQLYPQVKVVAVTGVDIRQLPEGFREGVDHLLQKPFRREDLVAAINSLLAPEAAAAMPDLS